MDKKVTIIAEAGVNHNGDIGLAHQMIDAAKKAGADIIKFQTAKPELVISKFAEKADYQKVTTGTNESQLEMCRKIHLKFEDYVELKKHCEEVGISFLSTPFDLPSIEFLSELGCELWKIPSGEITNMPYLIKIAKTGKPVLLSTGMCTLQEIRTTVDLLKANGCGEITLLQCTTEYPAPYDEVNLNTLSTLKNEFNCSVGFSDHTKGIVVPLAAVAMGAEVIEKHFTLDKNMTGPDHKASIEPDELKALVDGIRIIELAKGSAEKNPTPSEIKNRDIARKSIVAARDIKCGEQFTEENITSKRPGNGISPMKWNEVIGKTASRDFIEDELIEI